MRSSATVSTVALLDEEFIYETFHYEMEGLLNISQAFVVIFYFYIFFNGDKQQVPVDSFNRKLEEDPNEEFRNSEYRCFIGVKNLKICLDSLRGQL